MLVGVCNFVSIFALSVLPLSHCFARCTNSSPPFSHIYSWAHHQLLLKHNNIFFLVCECFSALTMKIFQENALPFFVMLIKGIPIRLVYPKVLPKKASKTIHTTTKRFVWSPICLRDTTSLRPWLHFYLGRRVCTLLGHLTLIL